MRTFEQYENDIVDCIKEDNIYTQNMIFSFYSGIARSHYFELKLHESDYIKNALDNNKNRTKHSLLDKWYNSDNASLQIGLFKILATDEELRKLSMQTIESKNDNVNHNIEMTPERAKEVKKIFDADY